ncbi:MAG: hypothetical protein ABGY75_10805 [Gemmataceae bacterium]
MTATTTTLPEVSAPLTPASRPGPPDPEPIDRAERFVRLPTARTVVANVVVTGRLKPLPSGSGM